MNAKGILIVGGIIAVLFVMIALPTKPSDVPPGIQDSVEISDNAEMVINSESSPIIEDSGIVANEGIEFYIDENGTKHYQLSVIDKPDLGD